MHIGDYRVKMRETLRSVAILSVIVCGLAPNAAAQATATVAGSVKDAQGAVVAGASVTLTSETRGTAFPISSGPSGDFILTNIPGDTYTVSVTMTGFKKAERTGLLVVPGDRVAIGSLTLQVGDLKETVEVSAEAPIIQTQTGERSSVIAQEAVQNVPITGTFFADLVQLAPGVGNVGGNNDRPARLDGTTNNNSRTNFMLDGVTSVNTGGNQPGINLNFDSIAEVKVLTNAYQAEYGRSSGLQVVGITKSGTDHFHGSAYDLELNSKWNTNSWANMRNGLPKAVASSRFWGGTIGGPVGRPRNQNKLFFFVSEQVQPSTTGGGVNYFRVPTTLERQGNFSQTTDQNGNLLNLITDPQAGAPCTSTSTAGCFQAGGVLGAIPQSRLYPIGLAILSQYPAPNIQGLNYNLKTVAPNVTQTNFQTLARADYNISSRFRISGKYAGQNATIVPVAGSIPGYNDRVTEYPALIVPSITAVFVINPTTILEASAGYTRGNQLGSIAINAAADRCTVGLCNFPELFPNAENVPAGSYQAQVLAGSNAPYYRNNHVYLAPDYSWGSRIANAPPNNAYPPFVNWQYTVDTNIALTKVWRTHTFKAGFSSQDSMKVQNLGTQEAGTLPIEGALSFANNSNNPLDTGFGYSNAAIGVFNSYGQQNALVEGRYVYHNNDFYIQDNWKVNKKLTLDLGVRFVHNGQQYDSREQEANFFPNMWQASQAPLLFVPGCAITASVCPGIDRVAINPANGSSLGLGSSAAIGAIVPGTGSITNGIVQAGKGIDKANYTEPFLALGPRVGVAWSPFGSRIVIRGAVGLFYDRPQGDAIFGQTGNPPVGQASTVYNSTLQQVAAGSATQFQAPPQLGIYNYNSGLPSSLQFNIGAQIALPWSSVLDVSFVQDYNYNNIAFGAIGTPGGQNPIDLNAPDLGTAYLSQYQDPTLGTSAIPGATALATNLLRPYRGLGAIIDTWPRFNNLYRAIDTSYKHQYSHGLSAGFNYTLGLENKGNMLSQQIFVHSGSTIALSPVQPANDALIDNVGFRRNTLKGYAVWDLPKLHNLPKAAAYAVNGWQLSVVYTGGTGAPYDVTYSYASNGGNVNLTGSPDYTARIKVVGNPGSGCGSNPYAEFNVAAFQGPTYNSTGSESGSSLLHQCFNNTTDLAILRSFRLFSEQRRFSFRLEAFNVFNTVVINGINTTMNLASPAAPSAITNNQYNADGSLNAARLTPATAGFGAATGAQAMRTVEAQFRFVF
jgi:hypothetical protein